MVYGADGPVGSIVEELSYTDDETTTIPAPFPINFFGKKFDGLCITTNGGVYPVATSGDDCENAYDMDLENLALDSEAPMIAALAVDLDLGNDVWKHSVPLATVTDDQTDLTVTTTLPHGLAVGDETQVSFAEPINEIYRGEVTAVISATSFTVQSTGEATPEIAVTGTVASGKFTPETDDSDGDGYADDGFGAIGQIYQGTTTIDGQDAWVLTWYRVPNYDDYNDPTLTNTFQIVLLEEPTAAAATLGSDFTIQYNYGLIQDGDDGYDIDDPSDWGGDCERALPICRWGIGWVDYDASTETADPYELFGSVLVSDILDGGAKALTSNSLNSPVAGRYTFKMIGGETVGFAVPAMDGSLSSGGAVEQSDPLAPVVVETQLGDVSATEGGRPVAVSITRNADRDGVVMVGPDFTLNLSAATAGGTPQYLDESGNLILSTTGTVTVAGEGFKPLSEVKVYLFSTPVLLGTATTDAAGAFAANFPLPDGIEPGVHTVQVNGFAPSGEVRSLSLGVRVSSPALASTGADAFPLVAGGALLLLAGASALAFASRRTAPRQS